jgi:hypothetical protein
MLDVCFEVGHYRATGVPVKARTTVAVADFL